MSAPSCCPTDKMPNGDAPYSGKGTFTYNVQGSPNPKKRSVLFVPDIFGFHPYTLWFADQLAERGNYNVSFADYFDSKPWPMDRPLGRPDDAEWGAFYKLIVSEEIYQKIAAQAKLLKQRDGVEPLCCGFCWGSKMVMRLNKEGLIACGAMPHPSFCDAEDAAACTVPCGLYPSKDDTPMEDVKAKLEEKKLLTNYINCDDVHHGFSVARFDPKDPNCPKRREEVLLAMLELFKACE